MLTALRLPTSTVAAEVPEQKESRGGQACGTTAFCIDDMRSDTAGTASMIPVARFYQTVGHSPVWIDIHGLRPQGESLLAAIVESADDGLGPDDDFLPYLRAAWKEPAAFSDAIQMDYTDHFLQLDAALTDGALRYAHHLSQGTVAPESLSTQWLARRRESTRDIPVELAQALIANRLKSYFDSLHPQGQAYQGLRKTLQQFEQIRRAGGWPAITAGPTLQTGDKGDRVDALAHRLQMTGDWPADVPVDHTGYDQIMQAAVERFQRRHGLWADGRVGDRTRDELNIPVEKRIIQLKLNMERWRWFPDSLGDRYLMVNIPAFELSIVDADARIDRMRAIVGRKRRQTPIMSGRMTYLEFNPYWNIPQKIARRDILPHVIADPAYLNRQGIRVFDSWDHQARELDPAAIDWEKLSASHFPYRLRQDPSDMNALGQVKFMFPNPLSVYIHDTPGRALFNRQQRSLSSGCVRVELPLVLAQYLLNRQGWDRARLETAVAGGQRQTVVLDDPIPVHLVYFTAWVDAGGGVNFRDDIYGLDRELLAALNRRHTDLIDCRNDALKTNPMAAGATVPTDPDATSTVSGRIVSPIASSGEMVDNPLNGL